jgi:hypothetical protein
MCLRVIIGIGECGTRGNSVVLGEIADFDKCSKGATEIG